MFSGITNQVTSWMGSAKGEHEEKVPTPTDDNNANPDKKETSPNKHGKLDVFNNVKSQIGGIGGWIGSNIPKFRKGEGEVEIGEGSETLKVSDGINAPETTVEKKSQIKDDDDDNSSATEGADSAPQSTPDSPTEDKDVQFGNVQSKALAGAKTLGNLLYSAVNKAGKTVTEAGAKIKKTVEETSILGEFNKEQEAFVKSQESAAVISSPPWIGAGNQEAVKEKCLSLSTDKRNFIRSPPAGVDFTFDYDISYPIAMAIMEEDPNLEQMRFDLVPKIISEENFWKNYFYRVNRICQESDLAFMAAQEGDSFYAETGTSGEPLDADKVHPASDDFVSDTLHASSQDFQEVQEGMRKLTMGSNKKYEEDWEKELEAELQDYEVVTENKSSNSKGDENNWDKEIDEIMESDTDLK